MEDKILEMEEVVEAAEEVVVEETPAVPETPEVPEVIESMDDYATELEASLKRVNVGDVLTGTILGVTEDTVMVDLKYYSQGVIAKADFTYDLETPLAEQAIVGDAVTATVVKRDDGEGNIVLSCKEAMEKMAWDKMEAALTDGTALNVKVNGVVKSGVVAMVEGIRAFIPASKLDIAYVENLEEWLGREVDVRVITVDREAKKLVLSAKELARERQNEEKSRRVAGCAVGAEMEGTVESIQTYGAFVRLENGVSGLLHISQVSDKRLKSLKGILEVGQKVNVRIRAIENGKLSLTMKPAEAPVVEEAAEEEVTEYVSGENVSTGLGALLAGLKL
ncbi:MAG: S1 RNA-binding domain-containing protein [Lachnospiraceae bacterium]|nr:S1 RNA-binding domain-containing protein [Lachnospiraceae bacterium]